MAADRTHDVIRQCGGIVHSDGNIFFTNRYQFEHAASVLLGVATVARLESDAAASGVPEAHGTQPLTDAQAAMLCSACSGMTGPRPCPYPEHRAGCMRAHGVMGMDEVRAKRISDALRAMQEMWDHLRRKGLSDVLMREYSAALTVLESDFTGRLPNGVESIVSALTVMAAPVDHNEVMALVYLYGSHCAEHPEDAGGQQERLAAIKAALGVALPDGGRDAQS